MNNVAEIEIRECTTIEEFDECVRLQREAFGLPELEISPRRHLIVSRRAGGWTLGAFAAGGRMLGFVLHLVAVREGSEIIGYSHMMAVARSAQNMGIGARLKWAQRERSLAEGRNFIKWTWDPMQARNAHFNLNRLGVTVSSFGANFYGTDYLAFPHERGGGDGLDSDRLFADWDLLAPRVTELAAGRAAGLSATPATEIAIPPDWHTLVERDPRAARSEQLRVRAEFERAFAEGLVCAGFERDLKRPRYLLYNSDK